MSTKKPTMEGRTKIGYVIGGSLKDQLKVRLIVRAHEIQEGSFVVIHSGNWNFYGLVSNIQLGATDPRFAEEQAQERYPASIVQMLHGQTLYTNLEVMPVLMLESGPALDDPAYPEWMQSQGDQLPHPIPIKTVPEHQASVWQASAGDIAEIFGDPKDKSRKHFVLGTTREQDHPVCIDLEKFVQRSSGIFGATGTGKSFLTRMILAGLIHNDAASILMFDMHNEYGFDDLASDTKVSVPGLRSKFRSKVRVVGLGADTMVRNQPVDFTLELAQKDILPSDIDLLTRELDLKDTTPVTMQALISSFGQHGWFKAFQAMQVGTMIEDDSGKKIPAPGSVAHWARENGVNEQAAEGLRRKLNRVFSLPYIVETPAADSVTQIIEALQKGQHIVLSFGKYERDLDYLLVANVLTRRIRDAWEKQTNQYKQSYQNEPKPLMIAIEEAHKLLNREMASQTIFSTIAREMRKYYVTLLVIDQRPSQIYDEVLSQLGTRISGWLGDDTDIQAVLSGISGKEALRGMLSRLQPKEEVLILGWGVPMPIPIKTLRYDNNFWKQLLGTKSGAGESEEEIIRSLFGKKDN
ncbi:MAG: ATP-binding protein [Anaerolineaceae bacterium]|nr:ATP-binding protein [Anaerolineaceae bacterium]